VLEYLYVVGIYTLNKLAWKDERPVTLGEWNYARGFTNDMKLI
jgi:hypothetical protein